MNQKDTITKTYDDTQNVELTDKDKGIFSEQDKKDLEKVLSRMNDMEDHRRISCPFQTWNANGVANDPNENGAEMGLGFDWVDYWNNCDRLYKRLRRLVKGRSNLKSSIVFAAVEAFLTEAQENEIGILYSSDDTDKREKIRLIKHLDQQIEHKYGFPKARKSSWKSAAKYGTAITYTGVEYEEIEKEVPLTEEEIIQKAQELNPNDEEKINQYIERSQSGKPLTKKVKRKKMKFIRANLPLGEMYFDPDAKCVKGQEYEAVDAYRKRRVGLEEIKNKLISSNDPYINKDVVKKLRPTTIPEDTRESSSLLSNSNSANTSPANRLVNMREYWNKYTDRYLIVINGSLVRNGPLPYNHGELPFQVHQFIEDDQCIYGMGFAWTLLDLSQEVDAIRNQNIETLQRSGGTWFYKSEISADMELFNTTEALQKVEVNAAGSIRDNVEVITPSTYNYNMRETQEYFNQEETKLTGMNSAMYSMPRVGEPVRNNQMGKESSQKSIQKWIENWADGEIQHKKQLLGKDGLIYQFITKSRLEDGQLNDIKTIKIKGKKLEPEYIQEQDALTGEVTERFNNFRETRINGDSSLELAIEYLDNECDIDFEANVDTWLPPSKTLRINTVNEMFDKLFKVTLNPEAFKNPFSVALMRAVVEESSPPNKEELLDLFPNEDSDEEEMRAYAQNELMLKSVSGEELTEEEVQMMSGQQGESRGHMTVHANRISELTAELRLLNKQLDISPEIAPEEITPEMSTQIQSQVMEATARIDGINKEIDMLVDHLAIDEQSRVVNNTAVVEQAMSELGMQLPPEPGMEAMPQGMAPNPESIGVQGGNPAMEQAF